MREGERGARARGRLAQPASLSLPLAALTTRRQRRRVVERVVGEVERERQAVPVAPGGQSARERSKQISAPGEERESLGRAGGDKGREGGYKHTLGCFDTSTPGCFHTPTPVQPTYVHTYVRTCVADGEEGALEGAVETDKKSDAADHDLPYDTFPVVEAGWYSCVWYSCVSPLGSLPPLPSLPHRVSSRVTASPCRHCRLLSVS